VNRTLELQQASSSLRSWGIRERIGRAIAAFVGSLLARLSLRGAVLGAGVRVNGVVDSDLQGTCRIASGVTFRGGMIPTVLRVAPGATLEIGKDCIFNYGVMFDVHDQVRIGSNCLFASLVRIADLDGDRSGPVVIGDDVWIAHGVIVQPGVRIGDGAVVAAGSVVGSEVPAGHLAAGNPARSVPLDLVSKEGPRPSPIRPLEANK